MKEMVGGCCVCSDERGWPDNPLVYCDGNGCTVAVHQACYGIVTVPTGPWYCRKCESPETKGKVRCELCPSKSGALKRTDTGGWAHVVCALYIPEVRFGNVTSMEPIVLRLIPPERYNKTCYICHDGHKPNRASIGACMQCNKSGCKQQFHVTCAQSLGLLCEEAGNYLDNVKYCGYCQHHYSKLKKGGNVKTIPPYKPVSHDSHSSDSSCDKEGEASPMTSGSGTPTHTAKPKGPGRKSSYSGLSAPTKNNSSTSKLSSSSSQQTSGKVQHSSDKKKQSPSRRRSSSADANPMGSKAGTPAPSPQGATAAAAGAPPDVTHSQGKSSGGSTPSSSSKAALTSSGGGAGGASACPSPKPTDSVGVISSLASATSSAPPTTTLTTTSSTSSQTSVVQAAPAKLFQESVITNAESQDTKQTKKRKAVSVSGMSAPVDYAMSAAPPAGEPQNTSGVNTWEGNSCSSDQQMDTADKSTKKAKTESTEVIATSTHMAPAPAAALLAPSMPPAAHAQPTQPTARLVASPLPGPSGVNPTVNIRSPQSQNQSGKGERDGTPSLLVSVPLPSTSHGLNLTAHAQVSATSDASGSTSQMFHQAQKQATMESSVPSHPNRSQWGGLNISYEMQDTHKQSISSGVSKDVSAAASALGSLAAAAVAVKNKKRAAVATSVVAATNLPPNLAQTQLTQGLGNDRRHIQSTSAPVYEETIKDSPPSSPSSERPLKPKLEHKMGGNCTAPHMLGNELNPESGAAARLQEQLSAELAAHAAGAPQHDVLVPPPLINKAHVNSGSAVGAGMGMVGRGSGSSAQSLDQLLERQWEQGSQFLMEQAQHFDIASLLSCLHQLRTENVRLEEHVGSLLQRRDHLLAVNARLAIPLTTLGTSGAEPSSRCARENGAQVRPPPAVLPSALPADRSSHQLIMREVQQKPS